MIKIPSGILMNVFGETRWWESSVKYAPVETVPGSKEITLWPGRCWNALLP